MMPPPKPAPRQDWPTSKRERPLCAGCLNAPPKDGDYCADCYESRVLAPGTGRIGGH